MNRPEFNQWWRDMHAPPADAPRCDAKLCNHFSVWHFTFKSMEMHLCDRHAGEFAGLIEALKPESEAQA